MRTRRAFLHGLGLAVALSLVVAVTGATAKGSPGVHVDPGSPAAKEYAIPLGSARGNGTPGRANTGQLFGQGITKAGTGTTDSPAPATAAPATTTPAAQTTSGAATPATSHRRRTPHRGARARHRPASPRTAHRRRTAAAGTGGHGPGGAGSARAATTASGGTGNGITWMLLAAVAVLALGVLGGTLLSRRGRHPDPSPS